jgi:L-xylulokinase
MADYLLGIDNGGTLSKAALYTADGKEIATASEKTKLLMPKPGYTERNMDEVWAANCRSIRRVIEKAGIKNSAIAAVATTGHGNGLYLVDDNLQPVGNGIISTDMRAGSYIKRWYSDGTFEKVQPKTLQSIWAGQPVALLSWFRDNQPEVIKKTRWVQMCKDYIRLKLTGEVFGEITDMSGTSLMSVRDVAYDREILEVFGLSDCFQKLPEVRGSADICGTVTAEAARATGLAEGTPVAGGLFDVDACAIATGIIDESKLCSITGTWTINEYISREPVDAKELFMTSIYCIPGYWLILEASATSASNLEWFVTQFGMSLTGKTTSGEMYESCSRIVENIPPEDCDIIFLPFLYGSNVGPDASSCFIGLNGYHTKEHMLRALYEGIVFSAKYHIERLARYRELPHIVRISGGAAKSDVWMQMFADILQKRIEIADNEELGTLGAAFCGGIASGIFSSFQEATEKMVRIKKTYEPRPEMREIYDRHFKKYLDILEAMKAVWSIK